MTYSVLVGRPDVNRALGISRHRWQSNINPSNTELNPTCHFLALLGAHPILHISRIRVKVDLQALGWGGVVWVV
jgi:hypothetical protein